MGNQKAAIGRYIEHFSSPGPVPKAQAVLPTMPCSGPANVVRVTRRIEANKSVFGMRGHSANRVAALPTDPPIAGASTVLPA